MKKYPAKLIVALILVLLTSPSAFGFSYDLNFTNVPGLPDITYAAVTGAVDGTNNHLFHFSVGLAPDLKTRLSGGNNFGMDKFFFNTDLPRSGLKFQDWDPATWSVVYNKSAGGFGKFDILLKDPGQRILQLSFDVLYTSAVTEADFNILSDDPAGNGHGRFAAHIGGFDYGCTSSTFVRDGEQPVPEPSSILLISAGIVALGIFRKRSKEA